MNNKRNVHARGYVRGKVTRIYNETMANIAELELTKVLQCISILNENLITLKEADEKILTNMWDDEKTDAVNEAAQTTEMENCDAYKVKINECLVALEERKLQLQSQRNISHNVSKLKPETAPLPTYSGGRGESLEKFLFTFEATVAAHQYTDFEKFLMLQKCVKDRAAVLLSSLEANKQCYTDAKALLENAFAAPLMQTYNTLERLIELNSSSAKDPLFLVSEMRQIKESITKLKVDINVVLQFFYWRALPESLKNQLILITNESKPTLNQIESNIFVAIERDQTKPKVKENKFEGSVKSKIDNFALSIDYKDKQTKFNVNCTLCSGEHPYFKCNAYKTPVEKLKRLKELNGCVKCGYINHTANKCKLNNLKCKICTEAHFPCLCTKVKKYEPKVDKNVKSDASIKNVNNSIVWTTQTDKFSSGFALPTFTCSVLGNIVRVMRDTGAQATLVEESLVNMCNFKVIDNNVCTYY